MAQCWGGYVNEKRQRHPSERITREKTHGSWFDVVAETMDSGRGLIVMAYSLLVALAGQASAESFHDVTTLDLGVTMEMDMSVFSRLGGKCVLLKIFRTLML